MIDAGELGAWLRLLHAPGVGRETARRLLAAFGSPQAVLAADEPALALAAGPQLAPALQAAEREAVDHTERAWAWLHAGPDRHVITLGDPAYPPPLLESPDPPLLLFVRGRLEALAGPAVAVVGSRRPTAQGRDHARQFARALAADRWTVVSGLATGVDGAAHEGALEAGGITVAVTGTGPDRVYPARHADLARRIAERGALVTEFMPGTPPLPAHFPQRNRIIAGLCQGTLVVEAALQSGSLITARLANEAGREVFAIPGSVLSEQSRGCHALIRDGARLIETPQELLDELRQAPLPGLQPLAAAAAAPPPEDPVLEALGHDPVSLDSLSARTGWPANELLARLLELELEGRAARLPGGLYQRRGMA